MIVVGLDPGRATGWAVQGDDPNNHTCGTWDLRPKKWEDAAMVPFKLRKSLRELLESVEPAFLCYEEQRGTFRSRANALAFGRLEATITNVCKELEVPFATVNPSTLKKHATGKGNASKDLMAACLATTFGITRTLSDDEVDAMWIAHYGRATYG